MSWGLVSLGAARNTVSHNIANVMIVVVVIVLQDTRAVAGRDEM